MTLYKRKMTSSLIFLIHIAGSDYTPTTQMVTFSPSVTSSSITVAIQDDNIAEDREQFFARAELVSLDADSVVIDPAITSVTIDDNDSKCNP